MNDFLEHDVYKPVNISHPSFFISFASYFCESAGFSKFIFIKMPCALIFIVTLPNLIDFLTEHYVLVIQPWQDCIQHNLMLLTICLISLLQQYQQMRVGYISGTEQNENGTEIVVVAYLDCIHELVSITFIVFIRNTRLPGTSAYQLASYNQRCTDIPIYIVSVADIQIYIHIE